MPVERYNSADLPDPLKQHLWKIARLLNHIEGYEPVYLDEVDVSSGSPTEALFYPPDWARRILLFAEGVSLDGGTDFMTCFLGTGGSLVKTGYNGGVGRVSGTSNSRTLGTSGFRVEWNTAATVIHGVWELTRYGPNSDLWFCSAVIGREDSAQISAIGGSVDIGGELDVIGLSRDGSTDAFDAGTVRCRCER